MVTKSLPRFAASLRIPALAALTLVALAFTSPARAQGVDFMYLAQQYGDNVFNILHTEIMNSTIQIAGTPTSQPARETVWPAHISEANFRDHVFTIDELIAMRYADHDRLRAMLDGQTITVQGVVERAPRADSSFRIVSPTDGGYNVYAFWRRLDFALPEHGSVVTLRGTVDDMRRRSYFSIANGSFVDAPLVTSSTQTTIAPAAADYAALSFSKSAEVSAAVAETMGDALVGSLAEGVTRQQMVDIIRGGQLQHTFAALLEPYGFTDTDLADVMASHLVMSWQIANDHPEDGPREGVLAVRDGVREALASAGWVSGLTDAEKHAFSETVVVGTMLIVARYIHGMETADRSIMAEAGADARTLVMTYGGPDLTQFDLTEQGFVSR
ncbi:MAG: hypothetical protein KF813_06050 [Trueperaceae bacterium]|nr:hypothetical protein [Trueperaceae bacterium]